MDICCKIINLQSSNGEEFIFCLLIIIITFISIQASPCIRNFRAREKSIQLEFERLETIISKYEKPYPSLKTVLSVPNTRIL